MKPTLLDRMLVPAAIFFFIVGWVLLLLAFSERTQLRPSRHHPVTTTARVFPFGS